MKNILSNISTFQILILIIALTISPIISFSQRIDYEWIKTISSSYNILSVLDKENNLIVVTNGTIEKFDIKGNSKWKINDTLVNVNSIAIDNENNFYITGKNSKTHVISQTNVQETFYLYIAKYNKSGDKIWTSTSNIQTTTAGSPTNSNSIISDSYGDLYITGTFQNSISFGSFQLSDNNNNYSAIFIAKYDSAGNEKWVKKMFGTNSNDLLTNGQGNDIVINRNNNIYVTGSYRGSFDFGGTVYSCNTFRDIFVTKLDTTGNFLKTMTFGGYENDEGCRMVIDSNNSLFLLAKFGDVISLNGKNYYAIDNYNNAIIIKLTDDIIEFATQIGYSNGGDIISDISLDKNQDIIYVGSIGNWPTLYPVIYKINSSGIEEWHYMIAESQEENFCSIHSLVSDTSGDLYITGSFNFKAYFGDSVLGSENKLWQNFIGKVDTSKHFPRIIFPKDSTISIMVFPTLTNGHLTISSFKYNLENIPLFIFNANGQVVKSFILNANESEIIFDELTCGIYFLQIIGTNFTEQFKIIKY